MQYKNNKYIIGGGISGLLFAYYNRDFTVISPDIGGRLNHKFFENIIYMHATPETESFLTSIGFKAEKKTQVIKYLVDGKAIFDITSEHKIALIRKKMGDSTFEPKDLSLSTQDYYIPLYHVDYEKLMSHLMDGLSHINESVIRITDDEIVTDKNVYKYDQIISTIPAPVFWKLRGKKRDFKYSKATFAISKNRVGFADIPDWDMLYIIDELPIPLVRVGRRPGKRGEDLYLYEFSGEVSKEVVESMLGKVEEYYVDNLSTIVSDANNIPPNNTLFVGRFAKWLHSLKQQDVIRDAKFNFDLRNLFNVQKSFQKNFINFNDLSLDKSEQMTKEWLLHLHAELAEVLEHINYKMHKPKHDVNEEELKEELIDCLKYLMNIMIVWGVDARELIEVFMKKTKIVQDRFDKMIK